MSKTTMLWSVMALATALFLVFLLASGSSELSRSRNASVPEAGPRVQGQVQATDTGAANSEIRQAPKSNSASAAVQAVPLVLQINNDTTDRDVIAYAKNVEEVFQLSEQIPRHRRERDCARETAVVACMRASSNIKRGRNTQSRAIAQNFLENYCQNYNTLSAKLGLEQHTLRESPGPGEFRAEVVSNLANVYKPGNPANLRTLQRAIGAAFATDHCGNDFLIDAGFFMLEKQRFRGHLQFVPNIELLGGEQVLLAARIARDLAECRGGSTCDPMGAMTITYCADRDICQPGLNFEAYLQQQLPPIVLQAAYAIDQYYGTEAYLAD